MLPENLRRRLETLNHQRLASQGRPGTRANARRPAANIPLDQAVPGHTMHTPRGPYWHLTTTVEQLHRPSRDLPKRLTHAIDGPGCRLRPQDMDSALLATAGGPADTLRFLDIETCGFAGSVIFLIGVMRLAGEQLLLEQFLARDYAEEPAILRQLADCLRPAKVLVTFNGRTFDWPCLNDRANVHRLRLGGRRLAHCDLLYEARRRWARFVPDCRLTTLERRLCGRARHGDIPGGQIPEAYHRFVKTRHAGPLAQIVHHNLLDLLTLGELLVMVLADELPGDA